MSVGAFLLKTGTQSISRVFTHFFQLLNGAYNNVLKYLLRFNSTTTSPEFYIQFFGVYYLNAKPIQSTQITAGQCIRLMKIQMQFRAVLDLKS